jgi:hypothetical protein
MKLGIDSLPSVPWRWYAYRLPAGLTADKIKIAAPGGLRPASAPTAPRGGEPFPSARLVDRGAGMSGANGHGDAGHQVDPDGYGYPCEHCARVVDYDHSAGRWKHKFAARGTDPVLCFPPKLHARAWPAAPVRRDRPYVRGLWANNAGPRAGEDRAP